ncbi:ral guanine nucleotide dissociation stimulator-like [Thomomys bottae]
MLVPFHCIEVEAPTGFSRGEAFKDSSTQDEILPFSNQDGMPQDKLRNALSSILDMWLDEYWEDFCQPAHFACLKQLLAHLKKHMPGTLVESRAQLLLAQMEAQEPRQTQPDGSSCPSGSTGEGLNKEKKEVLDFPPLLVAEQLTRMDSELFLKVVPHHCLHSAISQKDRHDMENLAPTIRATFTQFDQPCKQLPRILVLALA